MKFLHVVKRKIICYNLKMIFLKHFTKILLLVFILHANANSNDLHVKLLEPLLDIKYRKDGTTNMEEQYTLFADQSKRYKKAGLNCSGFVFTAIKRLFGESIPIDSVLKDINQNSGKNSPLGEDWDFGRDLILNIAHKYKHRFLNEGEIDTSSSTSDGVKTNDVEGWKKIFKQIKKDNIYLATFSKPVKIKNYKVLYYHVGIIIKDNNKNIWLYHSTPIDGVHRTWLDYDKNMTPFNKEYKKHPDYDKRVLILEIDRSKNE